MIKLSFTLSRVLLGALALALAFNAAAKEASALSYNRVAIYGLTSEVDGFEDDAKGVSAEASWEVGSNIFLWGSYTTLAMDQTYTLEIFPPIEMKFEVEGSTIGAGAGYHYAVSDQMSLFGSGGIVRAESETEASYNNTVAVTAFDTGPDEISGVVLDPSDFFYSDDDDAMGFRLHGGVRYQATPQIELNLAASLEDYDDMDSTTATHLGIEFSATDNIGIGGALVVQDEETTWGVGAVLRF